MQCECNPMKMTTTAGSGGGGTRDVVDEAFARIKMGVNVDIKRSDGKKDRKIDRKGKRREFYCPLRDATR